MKQYAVVRRSWIAAGLASALASSSAHAADCEDEADLFSKNWFLAKVDCGVDQLLEKGTSVAIDLAKNLGKAWLSAYIPGIADLLFGKDSSAMQTKIILDAIDQSKRDVIRAMVGQVYDEQIGVTWPLIQEKVTEYSYSPFWVSLGLFKAGYYSALEGKMDDLRVRLQAQENVFRLDALHTLATLVDMQITMKPSTIYWASISGRGLTEASLAALTQDQRDDIQAEVDYLVRPVVNNLLTGINGSLIYFENLARNNKFRTYNDQSFTPLRLESGGHFTLGYQGRANPSADNWMFIYKYDTVRVETVITGNSSEPTRQEIHDPAEQIVVTIPPDATCGLDTGSCSRYVAFSYLPDGTFVQASDASPIAVASKLRNQHKDFAYRNSLVAAYGSVRPAVDRWYRGLGRAIPQFAADNDLNNIVLSYKCLSGQGCTGPMFELVQLFDASSDRPLAPSSDPNLERPVISEADRRSVVNYIVQYGANALTSMRWSAFSNDPMAAAEGGPPSKDYLDLIRSETDPTRFQGIFRGRFAAKVMVAL